MCSGRPTTAPGRTSILTPATRRSAAPRARSAKAAPGSGACLGSRHQAGARLRHRRRPRLYGDVCLAGWREASGQRPRGQADHLRQLRYVAGPVRHGQIDPREPWFYFTEDELSPGAVRVGRFKAVFNLRGDDGAADRRPRGRQQSGLEGPREIRRDRSPDFRSVAGSARALRHLHEQFHRAHMDAGDVQRRRQRSCRPTSSIRRARPRARPTPGRSRSRYQRFQWVREKLEKDGFETSPLPTGN